MKPELPAATAVNTSSPVYIKILSALLGIIVTVAGGMMLWKLQSRNPRLTYEVTDSIPFSGPTGTVSIYQVVFRNQGDGEAEDASAFVQLPSAKIENYRITVAPTLNYTEQHAPDSLRIAIPMLNPADSLQIVLFATSTAAKTEQPVVSFRAKGFNGIEEPTGTGNQSISAGLFRGDNPFFTLLFTALATLTATAGFVPILKKARGNEDQRHVLALVCRMHGLKENADQYLSRPHEATYWAEADRIGQAGVESQDQDQVALLEGVLASLLTYARMARGSRAVVHYNLARIAFAHQRKTEAETHLSEARRLDADIVSRRLQIDPVLRELQPRTNAAKA